MLSHQERGKLYVNSGKTSIMMLPLTHKDSPSILIRIKEKILSWKRLILSDRDSRNLFLVLMLTVFVAFMELIYGWWMNSLSLMSDSFHMFIDCGGLLLGFGASIVTKWRANERFSYGYVRAEVLAGFINGMMLLGTGLSIMFKAIHRALEPQEVNHEKLLLISIIGLLVNLVGIYFFGHAHAGHGHSHGGGSHGHSHGGHGHSHGGHSQNHGHSHNHHDIEIETSSYNSSNSQIMKGVYLHILADTLGSVGVIISAVLMQMFGWMIADPICSMVIAVLILLSVVSLVKDSTYILMQRQPEALDHSLAQCYSKVTQLAGVYSVQDPHFWTLSTNNYIGCMKLEVARTVDPKYVLAHTQMIFHAVGVKQLTVQLDYAPM